MFLIGDCLGYGNLSLHTEKKVRGTPWEKGVWDFLDFWKLNSYQLSNAYECALRNSILFYIYISLIEKKSNTQD